MNTLQRSIIRFIDSLYVLPVRRVIPMQTFRYAVVGAGNMVFGWLLYYAVSHWLFRQTDLSVGDLTVTYHSATLLVVFPIVFINGFVLNKYIAFKGSPLRGRTQLIRYALAAAGSFFLNYALLKFFVEAVHIYPTPSQMISTILVTVYSYLMQKYFTFRGCDQK